MVENRDRPQILELLGVDTAMDILISFVTPLMEGGFVPYVVTGILLANNRHVSSYIENFGIYCIGFSLVTVKLI